ncbi:MAG: Ig-like domain-containing protein [Verrucomicrobia bacterium]|nr:Ig-like domain-containing protein [Verrucomicrobiota bacterium]
MQQDQEDSRFYRVVDISPIAVPDFVQVQQGSEANALDILRNDQAPNDEDIFVSDLFYSEYGGIDYAAPHEEDGVWISVPFELFYTPNSDFNGVDYLGYGIVNSRGGKNYTDVFVFVNENGNNPPVPLSNINLILETNINTASFNTITNMFDSNGDFLELFAVIPPQYGTATGTNSGNITYTRNPHFFGDDSFSYIVTDGRGAMAEGKVVVELIKSTNDPEIPIQWLINYGLSTSNTNSFGDLDDDGLPNIAEFLLGTNPRLEDNPINLQTITNGTTLTGCAYFPLVGCDKILKSNRTAIGLLVNEEVSDDIYVTQGMDGTWFLKWDTSLVTNGTYSIQAFVEYGYGENEVVYGTQKNVAVYNSLQFNPLANRFSSTLCIDAMLADNNTETNYTVYLYDEYDEQLVSGVMSVTDDRLYYGWNLCNSNGVQVVYGGIKAKFFPGTSQTNPSETGAILKSYEKEGHISYPNTFTVAWGWDEYGNSFVNQRTSLMRNGVINYLNSAALDNPYTVLPIPQNDPDISTAFCYDTFGDKNTLTNALAQSGNFFWFGHGGEDGFISGNPIFSSLSSDEIAKLLGNSNLPGNYMEQTMRPEWNKRPYRLTVLNSCYSHDKFMAAAFGVDFTERMSNRRVNDYIDCGREPRAYVGWKGSIVVPTSAWTGYLVSYYYQSAMSTLWSKWMNEKPLNECLDGFDGWIRGHTIFYGMTRWNISGCYDLRRSNPEVIE